jgi:hypothetical protein
MTGSLWFLALAMPNPVTAPFEGAVTLSGYQHAYRVEVNSSKGPILTAFRDGKLIWSYGKPDWRAWKLVTADVTGDGKPEFIVALNKTTKYKPWRHNTLFVFGIRSGEVRPLWRGSALGRPFDEFVFSPAKDRHGESLVTVERTLERTFCLGVYRWNGFGFNKLREFGPWANAKNLTLVKEGVAVEVNGRKMQFDRGSL